MELNRMKRKVDPEPILLSIGILSCTAAVVGMIDVIRRARRQERLDKETALKNEAEEARAEREEERQIREDERRQKEFERAESEFFQRKNLIKLDATLEALEERIVLINRIVERSERIDGTNRYWLSEEDYYRYREHSKELMACAPKINEIILDIEPTLNESAVTEKDWEPIDDDLEFDELEILRVVDQAWLSSVVKRAFPDQERSVVRNPFKALMLHLDLARNRLKSILN